MTTYMNRADKRAYSSAGKQLEGFSHIAVASNVDLPAGEAEMDGRVRYRAAQDEVRKGGIPVLWAGMLLILTVAILFGFSIQGRARERAYQMELELLQNRFYSLTQQRIELEEDIAAACDPGKISYYAAKELGMQKAVDSQTIQVIAPATRTTPVQGKVTAANNLR